MRTEFDEIKTAINGQYEWFIAPPPASKKSFYLGLLIPLLLVGIATASNIPSEILRYINSNGTEGSPIAVDSGNITYKNITIIAGEAYNLSSDSNQTMSTNETVTKVANITANVTLTSNVTISANATQLNVSSTTFNNATDSAAEITPIDALSDTYPVFQIRTNENYTMYVVENKHAGEWFRWMTNTFLKGSKE